MNGGGRSVTRAIVALVLTVGLVIGIPALLATLVGNPFPSEVPTVDEIRILLTQNGQGFTNFVIGSLAIIVWALWVQLVVALIVELVATARKTQTRRLPLAPGIQHVAAKLIASLTLATSLATAPLLAPVVGALTLPDSASAFSPAPAALIDVRDAAGHDHSDGAPAARPLAAIASFSALDVQNAKFLTVHDRTELWDLAEAAYGDGVAWKLIATANAGKTDADGVLIASDTAAVAAGTAVTLPQDPDAEMVRTYGVLAETTAGSMSEMPVANPPPVLEAPVGQQTNVHVVAAGESMWTIAHTELANRIGRPGSGAEGVAYWAEVVDANQDIPSGDVDLLYPGDELTMPALPSSGVSAQGSVATEPSSSALPVAESEADRWSTFVPSGVLAGAPLPTNGSAIASRVELDDRESAVPAARGDDLRAEAANGQAARSSAAVNETLRAPRSMPSTETGAALTDGGVGSVAGLGVVEADVAGQGASAGLGVVEADAAGDTSEVASGAVEDAPDEPLRHETDRPEPPPQAPRPALGLMAFGSAVFAAGVVGAVRRRRSQQRRMRPAGAVIPPPSSEASAFEAALTHASHEVIESRYGAGWQMLPAHVVDDMRAAGPLQFHTGVDGVVAATSMIPGRADWQITRIDLADDVAGDSAKPEHDGEHRDAAEPSGANRVETAVAPTSLTVGTDNATGEAIFLDLASATYVALEGDEEAVEQFARSAVLDLAVSSRADDLLVIAVNAGPGLEHLDRVVCAGSFDDALAQARRSGHAVSDSATPVIVVSSIAPEPSDASVTELAAAGVAIVAPGIEATTRIELVDGHATISPSGTMVELVALDDRDFRSVAELIDRSRVEAAEPQPDTAPGDPTASVASTVDPAVSGPIEVKVLGPVEIAGAAAFSSLKAVDVVTYLAFHRNGADADQIKTWVWPPFDPPTDKAFANVLSRARTALGTDEHDVPYLSRAGADRTYRLAPEVTTDFDRFQGLVAQADESNDQRAELSLLRQALELIRGVPFSGGAASSFVWADSYVRAQVEYTIDDTAHRCADLALELGDLSGARWAALKGSELVPGCEQCFRRRFLVASAGKNRSELRRAMADLEACAAAELGEPEATDAISADLLELYRELDHALVAGPS